MADESDSQSALVLLPPTSLATMPSAVLDRMSRDLLLIGNPDRERLFRVGFCGMSDASMATHFKTIFEMVTTAILGPGFTVETIVRLRASDLIGDLVAAHFDLVVLVNPNTIVALERPEFSNARQPLIREEDLRDLRGTDFISRIFRLAHRPVIVLTPFENDWAAMREAGAAEVLRLPVPIKQIEETVRRLLVTYGFLREKAIT